MCNTNSKRRPWLWTRMGYKAHFSIILDHVTNNYIVRAFEEIHCHKLPTFREVSWVLSHRNIDTKDLSQIDAMGNCCIRPCLTYEYMVNQKGGYSKIGFTQKDMYNWIDAKRWDEAFERDSHAALMYLQSKENSKTNFYYRVSIQEVDEDSVWDSDKHSQPSISCDYNLFEGKGIPCHHMFYFIKVEHLRKSPESLIFKRWTKSAAHDVLIKLQPDDEFSKGIDISRFASLSAECNYLYHNRSQTEEVFNLLKKELLVLQNTLRGLNNKI
ncbi:hypothetical protein Ddye_026736 [Dipteronia dyeriana]|uniref:Protein FAR1-RELATED SEQUENCE n=1 Tax=Dipteronia dyeriana TaxID=168575 RepID=A0AAD9WPU0_9ROSI|nr:hypothetical protein Ddye_026736 [Dipteronia dyeriana]